MNAPLPALHAFDNIADRVKLSRQAVDRPVVVVEGKSDRRFVHRVFGRDKAEVFVAGTRDAVLRVAIDSERLALDRIACVVDRDFDLAVESAEISSSKIACYDDADLEAMLWHTSTLDALIEELASDEKLGAFGGVDALRSHAAEVLQPLEALRTANAAREWGLTFDNLDLARRIDRRHLTLSVQSLCDALWRDELGVAKKELYAAATEQPRTCPATGRALIRGRDALAVAAVALRRAIGGLSHQQAQVDRLEESLRLAATRELIAGTRWVHLTEHLLLA